MSMERQLQEAKNRLSQLINETVHDGAQIITVRGKPTAVLLSMEEYQRLTTPRTKLTDFFRQSPLYDEELDLKRSPDLARKVEL